MVRYINKVSGHTLTKEWCIFMDCCEVYQVHQWMLEAAYTLGQDIERLSQEMGDAPHPCPCSCNGSHSQSKLERRVTFWELEVDSESG